MKKTSVFQNSLIWFGAGVSIAEILTGTYFAPLGMAKGFAAILLGHLIGCTMMFFAGLIGGRTGLSAMETSKLSFGKKGSLWFAALNVLQLVGWTAIMIYDGALAANGIAGVGAWLWCLVIGALILVWILIGLTDLGRINQVVMVLLFVLTLVMCKVIFFGGNGIMTAQDAAHQRLHPRSRKALCRYPGQHCYLRRCFLLDVPHWHGRCHLYRPERYRPDPAAGWPWSGRPADRGVLYRPHHLPGCWSAGISAETIAPKFKGKQVALIVTVIGTVGAIVFPMDDITDFLYLIGSVFAPMIAVQIADAFILHSDASAKELSASRMIIWLVGFVIYRILMNIDFVLGNTLPDMLITMFITVMWGLCVEKNKSKT